jgi:hypothetical protein
MLALATAMKVTIAAVVAGTGTTPAPVTEPYQPSIDAAYFGGPVDA